MSVNAFYFPLFYITGATRQPHIPAPLIHKSMVYNTWPGGLHL